MKSVKQFLRPDELRTLQERFAPFRIAKDWDLAYEGHVPIGAVILVEGEAVLTKNNRVRENLPTGSVYGARELRENVPAKFGCRLREGSKIILLHRSELDSLPA